MSKERREVVVTRFWFENQGQDCARILVYNYVASPTVNLMHQFNRMYEGNKCDPWGMNIAH